MVKYLFSILLLLSIVSCNSICDRPSIEKVKGEFIGKHPDSIILSIVPTEGDSSAAYFKIDYKIVNDEKVRSVEWLYLTDENCNWRFVSES